MANKLRKVATSVTALVMASSLAVGLAACGGSSSSTVKSKLVETDEDFAAYWAESAEIYNDVLGDFYSAYQAASEADSISERYALMAIAEAKLLETGVMVPLTTDGGRYALSRLAPKTVDYAMWGNDSYRYHQALVTTNLIKATDRSALKELYAELKEEGKTGAEYSAAAKTYLEGNGYTLKDTYNMGYTSEVVNWDVLATSRAADSEALVNTYDGLMEYDEMGILQYALAESYTVSEDGLTYTFTIRQGVNWVNSQGNVVAELKADDFVAGFQHMLDAKGGLESLVEGIISGAAEYNAGNTTDFSTVGVKATGDYTLEYTLESECSYFLTMLGYGIFAPMSRSYYVSQGGGFGTAYDNSSASYLYGTDHEHIAYCGPYTVTEHTNESTITFSQNASYWNKDNINLKTITWKFNDGTDTTKAYTDTKTGVIDGCSLTSSNLENAKSEKLNNSDADTIFNLYGYVTDTQSTSYMGFYNLNRYAYSNGNDGAAASKKTTEQAERTSVAMLNQNFRLALSFAFDRGSYNAIVAGDDLALTAVRNTYIPGTFVSLTEDVTVSINGASTKFTAGTFYGAIVQAQITADGYPIKVWDPEADDGVGSSDGFDGWYNAANAVTYLNKAITELEAQGVTISESNPIYIDYPYAASSTVYTARANSYKQSIEEALGKKVIINLVACSSTTEWLYAGYYSDYGYEMNYDMYDLAGWGPDYGDPSTYLDTFLPQGNGYMAMCIGLF